MKRMPLGLALAVGIAAPALLGMAYAVLGATGHLPSTAVAGSPSLGGVFASREVGSSVVWSLYAATAATTMATISALALAVATQHMPSAASRARMTTAFSLAVPHLVAAALAITILSQSGLIARFAYLLGWIHEPRQMPAMVNHPGGFALILTFAWKEWAFLSLLAMSALAVRGPALEEIAQSLGATPAQTRWHITIPLLWRALRPGVVAVFLFVLGNYEVPALLGPTSPVSLPVLIHERYTDLDWSHRAEAYALILLSFLLALGGVALHEWARARDPMIRARQ